MTKSKSPKRIGRRLLQGIGPDDDIFNVFRAPAKTRNRKSAIVIRKFKNLPSR